MIGKLTLLVASLGMCGAISAETIDHEQEISMARCTNDSDQSRMQKKSYDGACSGSCECDMDDNGNCCSDETSAAEETAPVMNQRQSAAQKAMQAESGY